MLASGQGAAEAASFTGTVTTRLLVNGEPLAVTHEFVRCRSGSSISFAAALVM